MKKVLLFSALTLTAGLSIALAAQPKPMDCDSWLCKGNSCAPAKYAKVRTSPILQWLEASPVNKAFLFEGGATAGALAVAGVLAGRRRRRERVHAVPLPADEV